MMRVAILGGSFNPPHVVHQMIALWAVSTNRADQVWLVPCNAHAFDKPLVDFEHRKAMCEIAIASLPHDRVCVSDIEHEMGGQSRTYNTLRELTERHRDLQFSWIIGADIVLEQSSWYRFDEIQTLASLIVVGRDGYPNKEENITFASVSSTDIRQRIAHQQEVSQMVPHNVLEYIRRHHLYESLYEGA